MTTTIPFLIEDLDDEIETSLTYALDFGKGRIIGMVDGLNAVIQFIKKAIITPRFKSLIYDNLYGSEVNEIIRCKDASEAYLEAEIPRMVSDAILYDDRILGLEDYEYSFDLGKDEAHIQFTVDTIYGSTVIEEVIL